jgi:hypothetical protein
MRRFFVGTMLCFLLAVASLPAGEYLSPKVKAKEHIILKAFVLPAETEFVKQGMKGSEGMTQQAEQFSGDLRSLVVKRLAERGVAVSEDDFAPVKMRSDENALQTVLALQTKYNSISTQMHRKPKDIKKGRYTIGDEVSLLPGIDRVDTLVFLRASGIMLTGGKKVFGNLIGGRASDVSQVIITFVDSRSGNVLSMVTLARAGGKADEVWEGYGKNVTKAFKKIPMGTAVKK